MQKLSCNLFVFTGFQRNKRKRGAKKHRYVQFYSLCFSCRLCAWMFASACVQLREKERKVRERQERWLGANPSALQMYIFRWMKIVMKSWLCQWADFRQQMMKIPTPEGKTITRQINVLDQLHKMVFWNLTHPFSKRKTKQDEITILTKNFFSTVLSGI